MLHLPSALRTAFETCLRNAAIPKPAHAAYTKWLRYYLDFCQKYHFPHAQKRVFLVFSTNYRKRSKPRRNNSRRHTRSRCITSLCASGIPTAMSLRSKKTILRRRLSMDRGIVLTHYPVKQAPPQKPALRGRLPINCLRRPPLPPTERKLHREFPG